MTDIVIVAAKRTPIGSFQGVLSTLKTPHLGAAAIKGATDSISLDTKTVDEVYMGCVLPAGMGQAPARQASIIAGFPTKIPCTTVNKVCGSGLKAIMLAADQIQAGHAKIVIAGGMENMSDAPYLLDKARGGYRLGHGKIYDHMFLDGLEDAYSAPGTAMGVFAERTADRYKFTREQQDAFALESSLRAINALKSGFFKAEVVPVTIPSKKGDQIISSDETPGKVDPNKIPQLKPAFREGGTVTAANSSSISDGAAAVILMPSEEAARQGYKPLASIKGYTSAAQEPEWFTTAPVVAMKKLCEQIGWSIDEVDLFEINEAFAVVTMAAMHDLKIPHDGVRVTTWGGDGAEA